MVRDDPVSLTDLGHRGDGETGSYVELSERFFVEATEARVPLDIRVLGALRSPSEIDLYV